MGRGDAVDVDTLASVSLDALDHGVVLFDLLGFIHRINPAAQRILGHTADELTEAFQSGRWETFREDGAIMPRDERPIRRVMTTGEPVRGAILGWRHRHGNLVLLRLSCTPLAVDDDGVPRFVVGFTDVTAQRRAERLLDATFAMAPVGLAVVDGADELVRCNPTFLAHADGRPEVITDGLGEASVDDEGDGPDACARTEIFVDQQTGDGRWIDVRRSPVTDHERQLRVVGTSDVTSHKRLEIDLTRYGQIIRNVNDVIAVVGEHGETLWASPSNERVLGYPDGTVFPGGILSLVHPDDLGAAAEAFRAVVDREDGSGEPITMRVRTADDDWKHFEVIGVNLLDEPTVQGVVLTCRDVTERQQLADELAHRASHDALTGLPNRVAAEQQLIEALVEARGRSRRCGVCYLDLDRFKAVNDTLGHGAGDRVLAEVGRRLGSSVRRSDLAARLGGDEFVVVLTDVVDDDEAIEIGRRIHRELTTPPIGRAGLEVGVSIGVATSEPDDTPSSLLARADRALYRGKSGPDKVVLATPWSTPIVS